MRAPWLPHAFRVLTFAGGLTLSQQVAAQTPVPPTALQATLDVGEEFRDGISLVWSPTGNAAWGALKKFHKVDRIEMNPRSNTAKKLDAFNPDLTKVLPPGTIIFAEVSSPQSHDALRKALQAQVGENAAAMVGPYQPSPYDSVLVASSLACRPKFPLSFEPELEPRLFTDRTKQNHRVLGFGTKGPKAARFEDAVRVLADDLKGTHALRLAFVPESQTERQFLVLSSPGTHGNMKDALTEIHQLLKAPRQPTRAVEHDSTWWRYTDTLSANDVLWVPHLHAVMANDYVDLVGKPYDVPPQRWQIREAKQLLNMRLDYEGTMVESTFIIPADFVVGEGPKDKPPVDVNKLPLYPKRFIFDKPFIASIWREGAEWPYLACWVDGPEMLTVKK